MIHVIVEKAKTPGADNNELKRYLNEEILIRSIVFEKITNISILVSAHYLFFILTIGACEPEPKFSFFQFIQSSMK